MNDNHLLNEFVKLAKERDRLKEELAVVQKNLTETGHKALERMTVNGIQNARIDGLLVHIHRTLTGVPTVDRTSLGKALATQDDTSWMVVPTYNANTLGAFVRELPTDDQDVPIVPPHLQGELEVKEFFSVRTRK